MAALTFRGAGKTFSSRSGQRGTRWALQSIDLEIQPGELLLVVGPSGSGKSTLVRLAAGLEHPDEGEVLLDGQRITDIAAHRRGMAMVSQGETVFPHLSAGKNLAFGEGVLTAGARSDRLPQVGNGQGETASSIGQIADWLGIGRLLNRFPHELSGGERQRVALGRAMLRPARVYLLDEPFVGLDPGLRRRLLAGFREHQRRVNATTMLVSHDPCGAVEFADRVAVLENGELRQTGTALEVLRQPACRLVADLFSPAGLNWMAGTVCEDAEGKYLATEAGAIRIPAGQPSMMVGRSLELGFAPAAVSVLRLPLPPGGAGEASAPFAGPGGWLRLPDGMVRQVTRSVAGRVFEVVAGRAGAARYDTITWRAECADGLAEWPGGLDPDWLPEPGDRVASAVRSGCAVWLDSPTGGPLLKDCG